MIVFVATVQAATWVVDIEGSGDFVVIQDAVNAAANGDLIQVNPGTYAGGVDFYGKNLRLVSTGGPSVTTLDAGDEEDLSVVKFVGGEPPTATLSGFTITHGFGTWVDHDFGNAWLGAGVIVKGSSATIDDCVFVENHARRSGQSGGGGLAVIDASVVVRSSLFRGNLGYHHGGAILSWEADLEVYDSLFENNVSGKGGGLAAVGSTVLLQNNSFDHNRARHGGALWFRESSVRLEGGSFNGNEAWRNGGAVAVRASQVTLLGVTMGDSVAAFDGGHFWLGDGSELEVSASLLVDGAAQAGGSIFLRGDASTLIASGVVLQRSWASEAGGDLWLAEGEADISQMTSLYADAPVGAVVAKRATGSVSVSNAIFYAAAGAEPLSGELRFVVSDLELGVEGATVWTDDPMLTDPNSDPPDVRLLPGSPAIDAGEGADLDGSAADLGATGGSTPWSQVWN